MVFLLSRVKGQLVPCRFCGSLDGDGHLFWECTFPPLVEIRENPEFHDLMRMDKAHWPRCLVWHGWLPMSSGVNGASPWAADASGSAFYLVEAALGLGLFVVICGDGLFLMRVIGGLSSWMFGILGVILIPLFMVGPLPWLLGFALSFLGWFLSLLFLWIFMVGCGFFVLCLFLVLCMVLRLLFLLVLACGS